MPRIQVPDYDTFIDFPDDTPEEKMLEVLNSNFPRLSEIQNPDGSFKVDITQLPKMPVIDRPRATLTEPKAQEEIAPLPREEETQKLLKLIGNPNVSPELRRKIGDRLFELDALEDPFVDPVTAFTGAAGAVGFMTKNLGKGVLAGLTALATDPAIGQATEFVAEKHPGLAFPFALATGIASGALLESPVENVIIKVARGALNKRGVKATTDALQQEINELTRKFETGEITADEVVKLSKVIDKPLKAPKPKVKAADVVPEAKPKIAVEGPIGDVELKPKPRPKVGEPVKKLDDPAVIEEQKIKARIEAKVSPEDAKKAVETTASDFEKGKITKEAAMSRFQNLARFSDEDIIFQPEVPKVKPKPSKLGPTVKSMARERVTNIAERVLESSDFRRRTLKGLSKSELEAIPFIREGVKDPKIFDKIGKPELADIVKDPSPKVQTAMKKVGDYLDEGFQLLKENHDGLNFVENYVTHIWDIPKAKKAGVVNFFTTNNPFTKKRKIPTLEEGIELGLKPKTTNIGEILEIYDQYKIKTIFNTQYAKQIQDLTDEFGNKVIQKRGAPGTETWPEIDHPTLNKTVLLGVKGKAPVLGAAPVKVHPDIAKDLEVVFGAPFQGNFVNFLENVSAFTKASTLKLSFFHAGALTEAAIASGIGRQALKLWNPAKIYRTLGDKSLFGKTDTLEVFKQMDAAKDGLKHGLTMEASPDVQRGRVQNMLRGLERMMEGIPVLEQAAVSLRKVNDVWDQGLWQYYHSTLKLLAYETQKVKTLDTAAKSLGRDLTPNEITKVKQTTADFVNDTFGGQLRNVNAFWDNPKIRQISQMMMLSVDWQRSTIKQALAPIRGPVTKIQARRAFNRGDIDMAELVNQNLKGQVLGRRGMIFWFKSAAYFALVANLVNFVNTEAQTGEGRFIWDNPAGRKFDIFLKEGDVRKKEQDLYISIGKQFREPFNWISDPLKTLGNKLNPSVKEVLKQANSASPGSGFPAEWKREGIEGFWKQIPSRAESLIQVPIPFSLRPYVDDKPGTFMFMFPTKTGMTDFRSRKLFQKALEKEDYEEINKIYTWTLDNNLNAEKNYKLAKARAKREMVYDDKQYAKDIFDEMVSLENENERVDLLKAYKDRGNLTPTILVQLSKLIQETGKVEAQKADPLTHFNTTLGFDRLTEDILEGRANPDQIEDYLANADGKTKNRLRKRFRNTKRLAKLGLDKKERRFWNDLSGVTNPEDRAEAYFLRWQISSDQERQDLNRVVRKVPGVSSGRFWNRFRGLKKGGLQTAEVVLEQPDTTGKSLREALNEANVPSGNQKVNLGAVAKIESDFNVQAKSPKGAVGLFQITEPALKEYNKFADIKYKMSDMVNPVANSQVAVLTLQKIIPAQLRQKGIPVTLENILMAYNGGTEQLRRVLEGEQKLPKEMKEYVERYKKALGRINGR